MVTRILFFFILSVMILSVTKAQSFDLIKKIELKADQISSDNIGNLYVLKGEELLKYDANGKLLQQYSSKRLGNIYSVDVSNPLKILVYYNDFSTIVFLDNMLAETGNTVDLGFVQIEQATVTCISHNNGLWVFDPINMQLLRFDQYLKVVQQTGNITRQIGIELDPNLAIENNNWLYLNNPSTGILVFDIYGTYLKTIPITNLNGFQVTDNFIYYFQSNQLKSFDLKKFEYATIALPINSAINTRIWNNRIYIQNSDNIFVYSITK